MAHGHDYRAVTTEYSSELIQMFYTSASKRVAKQRALDTMTLMNGVRLAYLSARDKQALGDYKVAMRGLEKIAREEQAPPQSEAISALRERIEGLKR